MNLVLHYLYRNEDNTERFEVFLLNPFCVPAEEAEERLRKAAINGMYFFPDHTLPRSAILKDWHELVSVETVIGPCKPLLTLNGLIEKIERDNPPPPIRLPGAIPISLAIAWWEFLRELEESLKPVLALIRKDAHVVVYRSQEDYHVLEETLALDAESGHFDPQLRGEISNALANVRELPNLRASLVNLQKKSRALWRRTKKAAQA
jgi:hypothetical protein